MPLLSLGRGWCLKDDMHFFGLSFPLLSCFLFYSPDELMDTANCEAICPRTPSLPRRHTRDEWGPPVLPHHMQTTLTHSIAAACTQHGAAGVRPDPDPRAVDLLIWPLY